MSDFWVRWPLALSLTTLSAILLPVAGLEAAFPAVLWLLGMVLLRGWWHVHWLGWPEGREKTHPAMLAAAFEEYREHAVWCGDFVGTMYKAANALPTDRDNGGHVYSRPRPDQLRRVSKAVHVGVVTGDATWLEGNTVPIVGTDRYAVRRDWVEDASPFPEGMVEKTWR